VNPAAEVGRLIRERSDALYLLDATQAVGQLPIGVTQLGCDLLTGTGRKFLRGPRGTGFLWAGQRALERLEPFVAEIRTAVWDGARSFTWEPGARRFETWENGYATMLGLGCAVRQALSLGLDEIWETARALGSQLRDGLDAIPGVSTHDLGSERCAIVTASVAGVSAATVASELANDGINVSTTVPEHNQFDTLARGVHPLLRLSPHYYNTEEEIGTVLDSIRRIALERH
jgi:selenocysteine lyase/cysteine desulfurase